MATVIKYFVVETDQYDEPKHPNIFRLNKEPNQIQLKDIKEKFTDWKGGFRFYFKTLLDGEDNNSDQYVWEDFNTNEYASVPTHRGEIFVKMLRTGFKQCFEIRDPSNTSNVVPTSPGTSKFFEREPELFSRMDRKSIEPFNYGFVQFPML